MHLIWFGVGLALIIFENKSDKSEKKENEYPRSFLEHFSNTIICNAINNMNLSQIISGNKVSEKQNDKMQQTKRILN